MSARQVPPAQPESPPLRQALLALPRQALLEPPVPARAPQEQEQALLEPLPVPRVLLGQVQRVLLLLRRLLIIVRAPPWRPELP